MDIKRPNTTFVPRLPYCVLTEDVKQIAIMKAALRSFTVGHERNLLSLQRRLKDGQKKIEICTRQSNEIYLKLNAVETRIREALLLTQEKESEALQTVKENGSLKRQIVDLKNDVEEQGSMDYEDRLESKERLHITPLRQQISIQNFICNNIGPKPTFQHSYHSYSNIYHNKDFKQDHRNYGSHRQEVCCAEQ